MIQWQQIWDGEDISLVGSGYATGNRDGDPVGGFFFFGLSTG